jgi:diguanylate cyclase (GGDEF)-like protein
VAADFGIADFLPGEIALVGASGAIVQSNRKWDETAVLGKLARRPWNYIEECRAAIKRNCADARRVLEGLEAVLKGERPMSAVTYSCPFDGLHHWYQLLISPVVVGGERHALLLHVDVSKLQSDALTGLANRAFFDAQLEHAIGTALRLNQMTGVVIVDMNNLKLLNDTHGHQTGDEALKLIASSLEEQAPAGCLVARIGGDEFGIVLPVADNEFTLKRMVADREPAVTASMLGSGTRKISIGASAGAALFPADGKSAAELYRSADRSMYLRKRGIAAA